MGKYRKKSGLFMAEGERCVEQILGNGIIEVEELIVQEGSSVGELIKSGKPVYQVSKNDFEAISDTDTPQGVIAVCRKPEEVSLSVLAGKTGVIAAFDAIQDPGNLGTMIRTASWFGVSGLIFGTGTVDPFHPKVVRSTAGATGVIPFLKGNLDEQLAALEKEGWKTCLLHGAKNSSDLRSHQPGPKTILVAGNEANGIDPGLVTSNRKLLKIPGESSRVESLNAAVALSIALYSFS